MTNNEYSQCVAFLFGWRDGHSCGYENNPYQNELRHFYKSGYDLGISDYCVEVEQQENAA